MLIQPMSDAANVNLANVNTANVNAANVNTANVNTANVNIAMNVDTYNQCLMQPMST